MMRSRAPWNAASNTPSRRGEDGLRKARAAARPQRPSIGSEPSVTIVSAAASAFCRRVGLACASRSTTRRAAQRSGIANSARAMIAPTATRARIAVTRTATTEAQSRSIPPMFLRVARNLARYVDPELRVENARSSGEGLVGEEFAPPRHDASRIVVNCQEHGARGAQLRVEVVVPLLLGVEFGCGGVVGRCGRLVSLLCLWE